jgi:hypothetical protein
MGKILLPGEDFPYDREKVKATSSEWFCYESKAGVPLVDAEGNRFTSKEALRPGMEVFSRNFLTGHHFKATILSLNPEVLGHAGEEELVADDGALLYNLVFEEGYWGYTNVLNKKAIRCLK